MIIEFGSNQNKSWEPWKTMDMSPAKLWYCTIGIWKEPACTSQCSCLSVYRDHSRVFVIHSKPPINGTLVPCEDRYHRWISTCSVLADYDPIFWMFLSDWLLAQVPISWCSILAATRRHQKSSSQIEWKKIESPFAQSEACWNYLKIDHHQAAEL